MSSMWVTIKVRPMIASISVNPPTSQVIDVTMYYRPHWWSRKVRAHGTILASLVATPTGCAELHPSSAITTHTDPAKFTVSPVDAGTATVKFTGNYRNGVSAEVSATVTIV